VHIGGVADTNIEVKAERQSHQRKNSWLWCMVHM